MKGLPTGLEGAWNALTYTGDLDAVERLTTLVWLRILTDPTCPRIGGNDPRRILDQPLTWEELIAFDDLADVLALFAGRLNEVMCEDLLHTDWTGVDCPRVAREVGRWRMPNGDPLGVAYQLVTAHSTKQARGAFYTPYEVSLMMASMVAPEPGKSVCDPCCGSGGMLLAALEACRSAHGEDAVLEVHGVDIDARAVRLCKLNLALAGIAPNGATASVRHGNALVIDAHTVRVEPVEDEQLELDVA